MYKCRSHKAVQYSVGYSWCSVPKYLGLADYVALGPTPTPRFIVQDMDVTTGRWSWSPTEGFQHYYWINRTVIN
ncbi:hypothetical protein J6590_024873 [Homalodisca vitripennis]|nr:hypothetical protein J6590_024873 [Homalodisca vitripennis]